MKKVSKTNSSTLKRNGSLRGTNEESDEVVKENLPVDASQTNFFSAVLFCLLVDCIKSKVHDRIYKTTKSEKEV